MHKIEFKESGVSSKVKSGNHQFRLIRKSMLTIEYLGDSNRGILFFLDLRSGSVQKSFKHSFSKADSYFSIEFPYSELELEIIQIKFKPEKPGLANFGATCYINSFMQILYYSPGFKELLTRGYYSFLIRRLFHAMDQEAKGLPIKVWHRLKHFIINLPCVRSLKEQVDVHEFSKLLFDLIESENPQLKSLIEGEWITTLNKSCGCSSSQKEVFHDIPLILKGFDRSYSSLEESLMEFSKEDFFEMSCEEHGAVSCIKQTKFNKTPPLLFFLISRFGDYESSNKINSAYTFPETLQLNGLKYTLFGVVNHSGGINEGHYYSYIRDGDKYYRMDDENVYEVLKEEFLDNNFGGYGPDKRERVYSGYYLIYQLESGESSTTAASTDASIAAPDAPTTAPDPSNSTDAPISTPYAPTTVPDSSTPLADPPFTFIQEDVERDIGLVTLSYITNDDIVSYNGLGPFNLSNYDYPLTKSHSMEINEYDNLNKIFPGKFLFDQSMMPVPFYTSGSIYVSQYSSPVFVKLYIPEPWCNYPTSLSLLGEFSISKFQDLNKITSFKEYILFSETGEKISSFSDIKPKGILVLSETDAFPDFICKFRRHKFVTAVVNGVPFDFFIPRGCNNMNVLLQMKKLLCNSSDDITLVSQGNDNFTVDLPGSSVYFVSISSRNFDINLATHVHSILLSNPNKSSMTDAILSLPCSSKMPLTLIRSKKESVCSEIVKDDGALDPNFYYSLVPHLDATITICYYKNYYELVSYPFLINNPKSVKNLRDQFFFTNKIAKYKDGAYITDFEDLEDGDVILVHIKQS